MVNDFNLNKMVKIDTSELVNILTDAFVSLIKSKKAYSSFPSIMLWGAPGVGKSQSIRKVGDNIEKLTKKKVNIIDVRLLLFNPVDLRGIPTSNKDKTLSIWLKPKIFDMNESSDIVNILFLDEISSAPTSVQAAAYQITLDRIIGEHKLPENCIVICAGNRISDKSVVSKMPKALANRLLHFDVDIDVDSWIKWARDNKINNKIISFIEDNPSYLMGFNNENDDLVFPTPRTWEMSNDVIETVGEDNKNLEYMIAGLVGEEAAFEVMNYIKTKSKIPEIEDFVKGNLDLENTEETVLSILKNRIVNYIEKNKNDDNLILSLVPMICKMPDDYAILIFKSCFNISRELENKIKKDLAYEKWKGKMDVKLAISKVDANAERRAIEGYNKIA